MSILKTYQIFLLFFLITITISIFSPMFNAGFSPIDDQRMLKIDHKALPDISINSAIRIFKSYNEGLYHPLVTLSYSLEKTLFGFASAFFYLDNILIHLLNIILVFIIFLKLSGSFWLSFIITALFAIHPTRTEVVCWISARKDLLYAFFYLLSVWFYIKTYNSVKRKTYMFLSTIAFLCSCFSKAMAITLPFVLMLIDTYTNNFNKQKLKIYFVYITIALIFVFVTINIHYFTKYNFTQHNNIESVFNLFNFSINFINSHFNILFYLDKLILPINLKCAYPYFYDMKTMPPVYILYSPLILYLLIYIVCLSLKKTKIIFYGFMFFIITIFPVIGILPVEAFAVADRYTYIPYLGLFFIFAKLIIYFYNKKKFALYIKKAIIVLFIITLIILGNLSYKRTVEWQTNSINGYNNIIGL